MSSARSELAEALRKAMLRVEGGDAAYEEINGAFHTLAHAISDVSAGRVMIGRLADERSGGDLDAMAAEGKSGCFPLVVRPAGDEQINLVVGFLVTSPLGFPVELRVGDDRHVAGGMQELELALAAFVASPHVARAVIVSQAYAGSSAITSTATRQ